MLTQGTSDPTTSRDAYASWVPQPADRGAAEVATTRQAMRRLLALGLVQLYRVTETNPDLSNDEAEPVFADDRFWVHDRGGAHDVALYLTDAGEQVCRGWNTPQTSL